jgi:hypothetical protein
MVDPFLSVFYSSQELKQSDDSLLRDLKTAVQTVSLD